MKQAGEIQIFVDKYQNHQEEKQFAQRFLLDILKLLSEEDTDILFEKTVSIDGTTHFIDAYIPATKTLIEMKSGNIKLDTLVYHQAKQYADNLPHDEHPRYIILCNFREFLIYDLNKPHKAPERILLQELPKELHRLAFMADAHQTIKDKELIISQEAASLIGELYDAFIEQYGKDINTHAINKLCTRLVFLLYAEDAGIFTKDQFSDYLRLIKEPAEVRKAVIDVFKIINIPTEKRDRYDESKVSSFPYVNGGLFLDNDDASFEIPKFNRNICDLLIYKCGLKFDWSPISPVIFGSLFESTLNAETRRKGGMHYTSVENIHKVIDPLFLNDLRAELDSILQLPIPTEKADKLLAFQTKLATLKILDPACGSGNFLTETFLSLSRLENEALIVLKALQIPNLQQKVSIEQFYGIEINDFAAEVAQSALWIAEHQQFKKAAEIIGQTGNYLPLKSYPNITCANALKVEWEKNVDYIIGNPPFVGKKEQSPEQKKELLKWFSDKGAGNLDYVCAWYAKALSVIKGCSTRCAFVSTNSITQGEQVDILWKPLMSSGLEIIFAYKSFRWESESIDPAQVHCVIIGFRYALEGSTDVKIIYDGEGIPHETTHINGYLLDAPCITVKARKRPLCDVPEIVYGSMPIDKGHLILSELDVKKLLKENPANSRFIRRYAGGGDLLTNRQRWCLWLSGFSPKELQQSHFIMDRINKNKEYRLSSSRPQTVALASVPYLFGEVRQPDSTMLVIPKVSADTRCYIPILYVEPDIIINGSTLIIPDASLYIFGVLTSVVHHAWMRVVAGRFGVGYQYSNSIVYNNFPWCNPTEKQKRVIEQSAQNILDIRSRYGDCSLAELYKDVTMPKDLRLAHKKNDAAVIKAYGWDKCITEGEIVAKLMEMYQQLTM